MSSVVRALALAAVLLPTKGFAALDVLVNQVGFEPDSPKVFRVQHTTDYAGDGSFTVRRASDNGVAYSGNLTRKGRLWDRYYWEGDFSSLKNQGDYYIAATVGTESADSYVFTIAPGTLLNQTGTLVYQYFYTQRCGANVVGWHPPCHLDDGIRSDNNEHIDAAGGWHDAGDYNKFPHGFAGDGVFALLWLYESNRAYYDAMDTDSNGIPDIIDEALHQARWLAKMVDPSGHVLQQTRMRRSGASWVKPQNDTDNVIGTYDDRWIDPGDENTPQETVVCAALIRMHRVLASMGLPTESFAAKALSIWNHRVTLAQSQGGHNNLGSASHHIFAGLDLHAVFGQQDCWDRALQRVDELATSAVNNPGLYDSMNYAEAPGYELGALAWFARNYPSAYCANTARAAVQALMARNIYLANDPIGLIRRDDGGALEYFPTNPDWNGFYLGLNRLYLLLTWGAIEAYKTIGDPAYLRFAVDQYNWVMGANYNRVCMMEAAGDYNLARYHTRLDTLPGHSSGKQPGCVPNGYVRVYTTGLPSIDLTTNRYQTNEGWLINNAACAMAMSELHVLTDLTAPGPVIGLTATAGSGGVTLSWRNPDDADFVGATIRVSTAGYPTSPTDGTLVTEKAGSPGANESFTHAGLDNCSTYYYSLFAHDAAGNYAPAANAAATLTGPVSLVEPFTYADGPLNGNGGWSGSATSQITVESGAVRISGGAGSVDAVRAAPCGDGVVVGVSTRVRKGSGTTVMWNMWIDDPLGRNFARWYGTGTSIRGRVGNGTPGSVGTLTGEWDDLYVRLDFAANESRFYFNGTLIGTLSHAATGAGEMIGRIRLERADSPTATSSYVHIDDVKVGLADVTPPSVSVGPPSALVARTGPVTYTVTFSEPVYGFNAGSDIQLSATGTANAGVITVSGSGAGPYTVILSNLSGDGTLGITVKAASCWDIAGNANTASSPSTTFRVIPSDGSIAAAKLLSDGAPVSLGNKALYLKRLNFGYVEEPDRTCGIHLRGMILADEGSLVCLTGTMGTRPGGERFIQLDASAPCGSAAVRPMGMGSRALRQPLAMGLYARAWGRVKTGSVTANSYVITDGFDETGIKVITLGAPGVTDGQFVTVSGAIGFDGTTVLYVR